MVVPLGCHPAVGVAGLTLGGGLGWLLGKYGATCDAVTAFEVVTAEGRKIHTLRPVDRCATGSNPSVFRRTERTIGNRSGRTGIKLLARCEFVRLDGRRNRNVVPGVSGGTRRLFDWDWSLCTRRDLSSRRHPYSRCSSRGQLQLLFQLELDGHPRRSAIDEVGRRQSVEIGALFGSHLCELLELKRPSANSTHLRS